MKNFKPITIDGVSLISYFPGTNENVTREEITAEFKKALTQISAGDYEEIDLNDD